MRDTLARICACPSTGSLRCDLHLYAVNINNRYLSTVVDLKHARLLRPAGPRMRERSNGRALRLVRIQSMCGGGTAQRHGARPQNIQRITRIRPPLLGQATILMCNRPPRASARMIICQSDDRNPPHAGGGSALNCASVAVRCFGG